MKYENTIISILIIIWFLTFSIVVIQSYELRGLEDQRNEYFASYYICKNNLSDAKVQIHDDFLIVQNIRDELIISEDGLRIEHELSPRIEEIQ